MAVLCGCLLAADCAPALREPPPLPEIGGEAAGEKPGAPEDVDALLLQARAATAGRDLEQMRLGSALCLRAAQADPRRVEGLLGAAAANAWLSEHETAPEARREAADRAVHAAQWCTRIAPENPACTYWLGVGLGVTARERPATGLSALPKIEEAFLAVSREAPDFDEAGPFRALAMLYARAPGWPAGPGDPDRAVEMAREAVRRHPEHPPNQLVLAEALEKADDPASAEAACREAAARADALDGLPEPPAADLADWRRQAADCLRRVQGGAESVERQR